MAHVLYIIFLSMDHIIFFLGVWMFATCQQDGSGCMCIYGSKFDDENFIAKHTGPGLLSAVSLTRGGAGLSGWGLGFRV